MRFAASFVIWAAVLAVAVPAWAAPGSPETLPEVAKKADYLVVGEVLKVEDLGQEQSDAYKMPVMHKRATIHALRAMKSSDATVADMGTFTVDYLGAVGESAEGPAFPQLWEKEVAVFPVKRVGDTWRFIDEEDVGMIAPAVAQEISSGWPADVDGNVAFVYRELAGVALYGDFAGVARLGRYLDALGPTKEQPADYIYALMKAEIGDSLMREDSRWMSVGAAAYVASGAPRPTLDALINGMAEERGGAARAPTDALPTTGALRLAALTLRKASKSGLGERLLILLIAHQEDEGVRWGIAKALVDNFSDGPVYNNVPMMQGMEEQEFKRGKPGALYVADFMVKDETHPLAAAAVEGARAAIGPEGVAREMPQDKPYSAELREAEGLILRAGTDDDFKYLLAVMGAVKIGNPRLHEAMLTLAGENELTPPERVLEVCRHYINDDSDMRYPPYPGFRLCDLAALTAARVGKQDFGMVPGDPEAKRNAAVMKAAAWLEQTASTAPKP